MNGLVTVNAGSYEYYEFTVPSVLQTFTSRAPSQLSGGRGNDIKVYVIDSTDFINWQNGHSVSTYYSSG